ncbi:MAG: PEP-CTERM sorting domain-containing protein, partial [Rhizomicrobium sp.]
KHLSDRMLFHNNFILGALFAWRIATYSRMWLMDRFIIAALVLVGSAAPALAGIPIAVPEPATMTLFGLGAGGAYLVKRFIGRK